MTTISRRSFLGGAAGGLGLAALGMLRGCAPANTKANAEAGGSYTFADTVVWDAEYDVVVLGMGISGMVSAKTAADSNASVVIIEKCPEGEAGGNSKVCGQMFAWGHQNPQTTKAYYQGLSGGRTIPEPVLDVIVDGVTNMAEILETEFDMDSKEFWVLNDAGALAKMSPEYPEMPGSEHMSLVATHQGVSDSYLFKHMKQVVADRSDTIDVWYNSPAVELVQDPDTNTIVGVTVQRDDKIMHVRALNGVCLCTGGFEANRDMVQHYLNVINYAPAGGLFNTGDGIRMAQKAGADLWHMDVYEGLFGLGGATWNVADDERAVMISTLQRNANNTGAAILVGADGERFLNESEIVRHGHMYHNGIWENPTYPELIWYVFDETQKAQMEADKLLPAKYVDQMMAFDTVEAMAEKTGCDPTRLAATIEAFNSFAQNGTDYTAGRDAEYMRAFDGQQYYAMPMKSAILNTQGGPRRNENAEVIDLDGNAIPHLYSAGECGGVTVCMYQGGTNIAECITFGRIAGKNAAAEKDPLPTYEALSSVKSSPAMPGEITDSSSVDLSSFEKGANQYVAAGSGMGGDVVVRVTMDDSKIVSVEVMAQDETEGIGSKAIEQLPAKFVGLSSTDEVAALDAITGATVTSGALKQAVEDCLAQVG